MGCISFPILPTSLKYVGAFDFWSMHLLRGKFDDGLHRLELSFRQESTSLRLGKALNDLLSIISANLFFKYTKRGSGVSLLEEDVARREPTVRALLDREFGLA